MDDAIRTFWDWFAASHGTVAAAYDRDDADWLDAELTPRVRTIHPQLNWEMGPYHEPDRTLVISPSIRDNIAVAGRVAASAPSISGWHILPAKPPKELLQFDIELPLVPGARLRADEWVYRLTGYNRLEFFDIAVFTDAGAEVSDRDLKLLTRQLIESLVGEVVFLGRFAKVEVHRLSDARPAGNLTPFPLLGRHVAKLLRQRDATGV